MIHFYSLFITDDELFESPYVRKSNIFHDITLHRGKTETVNFLLQTTLTSKQKDRLNIIYDPLVITLHNVHITSYTHQTLLTIILTPKELGSVRIGFSYPEKTIQTGLTPPPVHSPLSSTKTKKNEHEQLFKWR